MTLSNYDLKIIGYSSDWIELGILSEKDVVEQISIFKESDDKNQEHYRHQTFLKFLQTKTVLNDSEIDGIFKLEDFGEDGCNLKTQRIIALLHSELLSREQLLSLSNYEEMKEEPVKKNYKRKLFFSELMDTGFSEKMFQEIQETKDTFIQEISFECDTLGKEQITWLYENGLSKKIRKMAKNRLGSRKYKS